MGSSILGAMLEMKSPIPRSEDELLASVESALTQALAERRLPVKLDEAARYALLGGGKRVRPLLCLRSCAAAGGNPEKALPAAVAIEMIHAFSLVHDDLPALDNDDLRRGRPTTHVAFGEALAILAGDALLSIAMEQALTCRSGAADIARELAWATTEMISGQVLDTLGGFPKEATPQQRLELIHNRKTGALLRAACRMGALAAAANPESLDRLTKWGEIMGLMFQVVDDILDQTQSSEHLGKSAGKDAAQGKITFPAVHGVEWSREHVRALHEQSEQLLKPMGAAAEPLRTMARALATRTR
ncbi:MAG: polyprenyl synthetase family protein [Planctomycetes bacterium]|nr:polyprenyl synthetase family protein [Planctomycetota bacterium]